MFIFLPLVRLLCLSVTCLSIFTFTDEPDTNEVVGVNGAGALALFEHYRTSLFLLDLSGYKFRDWAY